MIRVPFIGLAILKLALLAACDGSQPPTAAPGAMAQVPPVAAHVDPDTSSMSPEIYKTSVPLLYVTNYTADYNDVKVYDARAKDPNPIAVISKGINTPSADCLDAHGSLYVTNQPASGGWVSEYPPGKTSPSEILTKGLNTPAFCTIDGKGNLWVTNIGYANVTEYEANSKKPHTVITKGLIYPVGIAIDHSGNMYVANRYTEGTKSFAAGNVVVYAPGKKSPSRTITDGVVSPVGITVDAKGTLYVTNITENNVAEYLYGESKPYQTITEEVNGPIAVTVNEAGWLYVSNFGNNVVIEFPPDSLEPSSREISKGIYSPSGTAYFPPLLPRN